MMKSRRSHSSASDAGHQVVDPCMLGRPTHLLPRFTAPLREDLSEECRSSLNRRYRAAFQVRDIAMRPIDDIVMPGRWTKYQSDIGALGCAIDRGLVLCALAYRYGGSTGEGSASTDMPTETEKRLAAMLSRQFIDTLAARINTDPVNAPADRTKLPEFSDIGPGMPPRGTWMIEATIEETAHGVAGKLCFTLCEAWMDRLLRKLGPLRDKPRDKGENIALATQLEFKLAVRLLEMNIPLGDLVDMQVGDIIPVRLNAADVMIDDSRLFTATVAEHKGKLCLTSFADAN